MAVMNFMLLCRLQRSISSWNISNLASRSIHQSLPQIHRHITAINPPRRTAPQRSSVPFIDHRCFTLRDSARYTSSTSNTAATSSPTEEQIYILRFGSFIDKFTNDTGIGIAIYDATKGKKLWTGRRFIPDLITNNLADYMALADALKIMSNLKSTKVAPFKVEIQTSNPTIAKHLSKEFKVRSKSLKPWYDNVTNLMGTFQHVVAGQIPFTECTDVKNASQLAVKEKKSCDNYVKMVKELESKSEREKDFDQEEQVDATKQTPTLDNEPESVDTTQQPSDVTELSMLESQQPDEFETTEISPDKIYILRFDGGSRGNPGVAGAGMALYESESGSEIWSGCIYLGDKQTNNEAEYTGLITGLQCALSLGVKQIVVQGDSMLVLQQIALKWKVKSPTLKQYFDDAMSLKKQFTFFETSHIERAKNSRADELANEAMDTRSSRGFDSE